MKNKKYKFIKQWNNSHDDMPDGAFFALAEEEGIGQDDWVEFSKEQKKDPDYK